MCISNYTFLMNWSFYEYIVNLFVSTPCFISKSALSALSVAAHFHFLSLFVWWFCCCFGGFFGFDFFFPSGSSLSIYIFTREVRFFGGSI